MEKLSIVEIVKFAKKDDNRDYWSYDVDHKEYVGKPVIELLTKGHLFKSVRQDYVYQCTQKYYHE